MEQENQTVTLLPSVSDVLQSLNFLFAPATLNGVLVRKITNIAKDVKLVGSGYMGSTKIGFIDTEFGPKEYPIIQRMCSAALTANILERAACNLQYTNGTIEAVIDGLVSPFLTVTLSGRTDLKDVAAIARIGARQPISHIDAVIDVVNRKILHGSALFGNTNKMAGLKIKFQNFPDLSSITGFAKVRTGPISTALALKLSETNRTLKGTLWVTKEVKKGVIGARVRYGQKNGFLAQCGWSLDLGKAHVQSMAGTDGIVSSQFKFDLSKNMNMTISSCLNHREYDYTLGISVTHEATE